jgi:hypothetical protein
MVYDLELTTLGQDKETIMQIRKIVQIVAALGIAAGAIGAAVNTAHAAACPQTAFSWDNNNNWSAGVACCETNGLEGCARGFTDAFGRNIQAFADGPVVPCGGGPGWIGRGLNSSQVSQCSVIASSGDTVTNSCPAAAVFSHITVVCLS